MKPDVPAVPPENEYETELCVKGLAEALEVSPTYVYQMRACGFPMRGVCRRNQTATMTEAVEWIRRTGFRMVNGRGESE